MKRVINNYDHDSEGGTNSQRYFRARKTNRKRDKNSNKLANLIINEEVKDALYKIAIEFVFITIKKLLMIMR